MKALCLCTIALCLLFAWVAVSHAADPAGPLRQGVGVAPPDDAIVLFDGTDFSQWSRTDGTPVRWRLADKTMQIVAGSGSIVTRRSFRDFRLHVEFNVPVTSARGQGKGNSGVYIQKRYEVQILDSYGDEPVFNTCGSLYRTKRADVNACKPAGQWQSYDIIFRAAKWQGSTKTRNARGVLTDQLSSPDSFVHT